MEVIVAEDEFVSRNLLANMLEKLEHTVYLAEDGKQALSLYQEKSVDIIISDWMMPGLDGIDLCKEVRKYSHERYTYIIILTAKTQKEDLLDVFKAGADDYIPKPFDPEELKSRIKTGERIIRLEERHRKMQRTIMESRNKIMSVFDALHECIVAIDRRFTVVSANNAFLKEVCKNCMGFDHAIGQSFFPVCTEDPFPWGNISLKEASQKVFEEKKPIHFTEKAADETGIVRHRQCSVLPIKDEEDDVYQVVIVRKDITDDVKKTQEIENLNSRLVDQKTQIEEKNKKLEQTLKKLEETQAQILQSEKMASIGQLAAGVAHEINNPTGFVSSNLKTLIDYQKDLNDLVKMYRGFLSNLNEKWEGRAPETVMAEVEKIAAHEEEVDIEFVQEDIMDLINDCREGTDRIKKIVIDLKDFAHPGEDRIQSTDINKGLESTLNVVNNEIKYVATVKKDFGDISPVDAYPQQLNQVFMNILVNAAQAIEVKGEISIKTRDVDGFVKITLSDTGSGISKENLSKIFDPFFTTKDVGKGTGLGMNIAYNIINKHNGTISVESEVGKGTTFTILLPKEQQVE